jgi:hypothetical protein
MLPHLRVSAAIEDGGGFLFARNRNSTIYELAYIRSICAFAQRPFGYLFDAAPNHLRTIHAIAGLLGPVLVW